MRYLSILKESLVETLDRKSLYFILVIAALLIVMCASFSFRELDTAGALEHVVGNFGTVVKPHSATFRPMTFTVEFKVSDVKSEGKDHEFQLTASPVKEFHRAVLSWDALNRGVLKDPDDPVEGIAKETVKDPGAELETKFLRAQFRLQMINRVEVEALPTESGARRFKVAATTSSKVTLDGAHEASMFFGLVSFKLPMSLAIFLFLIETTVAEWIAGFFGVMLAVVFTAGFVPGMLQKGTLDLLLAKPVRRPLILLTKYFGGLFYVLIPATLLIGGCWLAISWRSGFYNFGFLASIGVLGAIFAVLYSFAVLMGVLTRSTIATILLTIGLWFFSFGVAKTHEVFQNSHEFGFTPPAALATTVEKVRLVLPRTSELGQRSTFAILKGNLGPELESIRSFRSDQGDFPVPSGWSLAISSVGFIVAMLGLACWIFNRRDY